MRCIILKDVKFSEGSSPSEKLKKGSIRDLPKGHPLLRRGIAKPKPLNPKAD